MNVLLTPMSVLTTAPTPMDLTLVVVDLDTHWPPTDAPVKVLLIINNPSSNLLFCH